MILLLRCRYACAVIGPAHFVGELGRAPLGSSSPAAIVCGRRDGGGPAPAGPHPGATVAAVSVVGVDDQEVVIDPR